MAGKTRLKFMIFIVGIAGLIPVAAIGLSLISEFVVYFQQGADPASIFRGHTLTIPTSEQAQWVSYDVPGDNIPTQAERDEIIAAYWLAWQAIDRVHATGDTTDIPTYWAGTAYDQLLQSINPQQTRTQSHQSHNLEMTFFSDDGSVVAFEDHNFSILQTINTTSIDLQASASVIMTLDQGFWRVRSITLRYQ